VPTRATVVASTPTSGSTLNGVKTPVRAGNDWIVTITSVRETTSSFVAPNAGSTYLEINMTFKNISPKTLTLVSLVQFTLVDASGHRYNETAADTNIHVPPDGRVDAGQTLNAVFASEVPQKQHTFTLTFAYGLSDNSGATVAWRFRV
jgi:hypothetical protein